MEETISKLAAELEEIQQTPGSQNQSAHIQRSTLADFQSLIALDDPELIEQFYGVLASRNLSPSSLSHLLSSTMDSSTISLSLLASKIYLSLLLSPSSPVFTLFTPISFLSLLRSIRRSLKHRSSAPTDGSPREPPNRKRKGGGRGRNRGRNVSSYREEEREESEGFDENEILSVLEMLVTVLGLIHLNRFPDSLRSLIQTVGEIPVMALDRWGSSGSCHRFLELCSQILSEVLRSEHGEEANTAAEILKALSPLIFIAKSQSRSFALGFISKTMMVLGKKSEGVKKAVVNLPRYLAQKAPEKAEPRALAVESILEIVKSMEVDDQMGFVDYVVKMTQGTTTLRLLAVDLIPMLILSLKDPLGVDFSSELGTSWGLKCLEVLIQRCSDSSAGIRAHALSNLAQIIGSLSRDSRAKEVLKKALGLDDVQGESPEGGFNNLLRTRCMDEKAVVRRAALLLLSKLTALLGGSFDVVLLKTMGMACSDQLVSIRKAAVSALSEVFRTFTDESVTREWLHSVTRLVTDNESSIQEECENLFLELVLDRVARAVRASSSDISSSTASKMKGRSLESGMVSFFPEGVLGLLKEICDGDVSPWVKKICLSLGKKKRLKPKIVIALQTIIKTSESLWLSHSMPIGKWTAPAGAWFLLSEVSPYLSKAVDWEFLHHHWQLVDKHGVSNNPKTPFMRGETKGVDIIEPNSIAWAGDRVFLLQTIANVSMELPPEPAADLAHNLLKRIEKFSMHSTEVNAHVKALRTLCKRKALNPEEAETLVLKWVQQIMSKASVILENYISKGTEANKTNTFFTPPMSGTRKGKQAAKSSRQLLKTVTAVYTIGSLVIVCPSADVSPIIPLLYTVITSGHADPNVNKLPGTTISWKQIAPSLYIQAWLTMGKVCLADGKLAKTYIPLFVQELEKSDCAALRNNLVVIMADFCVRYTALVDCYITKITRCLRDSCELVRRQTFIMLSRLLQRDYVKWRGVLFLRFLLCLVDESDKIRHLANFLFGNILKAKAPLLAYNSFVEAIYVLNDCHAHDNHKESKNARTESRLFSIRGNDESSRSKRMHIYFCLLKQMAPEHLLATFAKLCAEILAAASDGMLNVEHPTGQCVLQDAFQILASKEIRITSIRGSTADTVDVDDEGGENATSAAKGRAITQAVRKGLIQNTIPIFIELKRQLESKNSHLTGSLMECLRNLLKDYKNEIDEMLVADKQLQKELVYDMQKYETAKARTTAAEAFANVQNPSTYRSPDVCRAAMGADDGNIKCKEKIVNDLKVVSALADAAAKATARSVLREVNRGAVSTPLSSMNVPKLKSGQTQPGPSDRTRILVLESLRKRQSFDSDGEN